MIFRTQPVNFLVFVQVRVRDLFVEAKGLLCFRRFPPLPALQSTADPEAQPARRSPPSLVRGVVREILKVVLPGIEQAAFATSERRERIASIQKVFL